jgi:hypothetical protein
MARLTEEEKKERVLARRAAKVAEKSRIRYETVLAAREKSLAYLSEQDREIFVKRFAYDNEGNHVHELSTFEKSISFHYTAYGKLSEAQVNAVLKMLKEAKRLKIAALFYDEHNVGGREELELKLESVAVVDNTSSSYFAPPTITVYRFTDFNAQKFLLKSNAKRFGNFFTEVGKSYKFEAEIQFITEDKGLVCINSVGVKLPRFSNIIKI